MKTSGFDWLVEINEVFINRALAVAYYTSAVPTYVDGTYAPTEKLPAELRKYARIDFELHLKEPPCVDAITEGPSNAASPAAVVRLLFNLDIFIKLFGGLRSRFDITAGADASISMDPTQNRLTIVPLHGCIDMIKVNNKADFPAKVIKTANSLIADVLKTNLLDKIKSVDMIPFLKPLEIPDPIEGIDSCILWPNGKAYFFKGAFFISYDISSGKADGINPHNISTDFPGIWSDGFDAAVAWPNGKAYFFRNSQYKRFDIATNQVDSGYPRRISEGWKGVWPDGIDSVIVLPSGKAVFFKKDEYIIYDIAADQADDGYPRKLSDGWPGMWSDGFDSAVYWPKNNRTYLFKGSEYRSWDNQLGRADPGYPHKIIDDWQGVWAGKLGLPVKPGGIKTINDEIFALGVNLFNNPPGSILPVQDYSNHYDLWLGVPQKALHQIFDYTWNNAAYHFKRISWVGMYDIMNDPNDSKVENALRDWVKASTDLAEILTKMLTAGIVDENITVNSLKFICSATISINKPSFRLLNENTIEIDDVQVLISVAVKCIANITFTTKVDIIPFFDDTGITVDQSTINPTLFDLDLDFPETLQGAKAQLYVDLQQGIFAKFTDLQVTLDLGIDPIGLFLTWIVNEISAVVLKYIPPIRLLPPLIKEKIEPKDMDLNIRSQDLTAEVDDDVAQHPLDLQIQIGPLGINTDEFTAAANITVAEMGRKISPLPKFIANANPARMEVHRASCEMVNRMDESYKRGYFILIDALHDGYDGCKYCLPEYNKR